MAAEPALGGDGAQVDLPVADLRLTMSPRFGARDRDHIRALAERFDDLPPIVVYGPTNEIVDGVHRVMAARLLQREQIRAHVVNGDKNLAYVEAVRRNVTHGKPLTMTERRAAARRLIAAFPEWSDRRVAEACGIGCHTVAAERSALGGSSPDVRIGRDGRIRPSDPAATRLRVARLIESEPAASLRDLARAANTSQATVLDVRRRLSRGEDPLPGRLRPRQDPATPSVSHLDTALRSTPSGADFADWFEGHRITEADIEAVEAVPRSRLYLFADAASEQSRLWARIASTLEGRARRRA